MTRARESPSGGAPITGGGVTAIVPDGTGGYLVAGTFTRVGGLPRRGLARLTTSGAVDPAFNFAAVERVESVAVSGTRLFAVGFNLNQPTVLVAADLFTGAELAWTPAIDFGGSSIFVLPNGNPIASGYSLIGGVRGVYELDRTTGAIVATWPALPRLTIDADTVIGADAFTISRFDVHTRTATAIVSAARSRPCTIRDPCEGIRSLGVHDGDVFFTGDFDSVRGVFRPFMAAVDMASGALEPWQPSPVDGLYPFGIHADATGVVLEYGSGPARALIPCNPKTGAPTPARGWLLGGHAQTVLSEAGRLVVGGYFRGAGGLPRRGLAAVRWPDGEPTAWTATGTPDDSSEVALAISGSRLFVATFSFSLGLATLREVDTVSGTSLPWSITFNGFARIMRINGNRLFVAGEFDQVDGAVRAHLASFDISGPTAVLEPWAPPFSRADPGSFIASMDVTSDVIVIAGKIAQNGGLSRWALSALDAETAQPLPWAPRLFSSYSQGDQFVFGEIADRRLWLSGTFESIDGQPRRGMASFDFQGRLTGWLPERPTFRYGLTGSEQRAWFFENHLYTGIGYSVEASDGSLTMWAPEMDGNSVGLWTHAPGRGLILHGISNNGFMLFPRVEGPSAVTALTADVSDTSVRLTWTAVADAASYVIEAGSHSGAADLARLDTHSAETTRTVDAPDGRYFVRVRAKSLGGLGPPSNEVTIVVGLGACTSPPQAPGDLRADTAGPFMRLEWVHPTGTVTATLVEASLDSGANYIEVARLPGSTPSFQAQGPPGTYLVRVRALNACGTGLPSAPAAVILTNSVSPPSAPLGLQATVSGGRAVTLSWLPSTGLPSGYTLLAGSAPGLSDIARVAVAGSPVVIPGVPAGAYYVRIQAQNAGGLSGPSNEVLVVVSTPSVGVASAHSSLTQGSA